MKCNYSFTNQLKRGELQFLKIGTDRNQSTVFYYQYGSSHIELLTYRTANISDESVFRCEWRMGAESSEGFQKNSKRSYIICRRAISWVFFYFNFFCSFFFQNKKGNRIIIFKTDFDPNPNLASLKRILYRRI